MQAWKRKALEFWPAFCQDIDEEQTPDELLITLFAEFIAITHGPSDPTALSRFYAYAWWCLEDSAEEEVARAAILYFYERLPDYERVCQEMHHYLTAEQFEQIKGIWHYGRSDQEYAALLHELQRFREGKHLAEKVLPRRAFKGISSRNEQKKRGSLWD